MTPHFIARQLAHPKGISGRIIAALMNRRNAKLNGFTVRQLDVKESDRVLEIGFGGGVALQELMGLAGFVCGIDRSAAMVERAKVRWSKAVATGAAEFQEGCVETLPFRSSSFDKVCTVNTVYFWKKLGPGFAEMYRVLSSGGRVAVGFLPKEWMDRMGMPADIFTSRTAEEVVGVLNDVGFRDFHVKRPKPQTAWNVIVASR